MFDRSVYITGMAGSGKSSLGKKVASNLHLPYVDMDRRITDTFGLPATEIFQKYGEDAFRRAETNMLIQLTREGPAIISTGGGCVMRDENLRIMKANGLILLIDRPLDQILSDIKLDRRPLLAEKGLGEVERMYHERIGRYREVADMVLDNSKGYFPGVAAMERMLRLRFGLYALDVKWR